MPYTISDAEAQSGETDNLEEINIADQVGWWTWRPTGGVALTLTPEEAIWRLRESFVLRLIVNQLNRYGSS